MVYIFGWLSIFLSGLGVYFYGNRCKFLCWITLFFVSAIAIFRGDVGTDTYAYQYIVSGYRLGNQIDGWEPAFLLLMKALVSLFESDVVVIRVVCLIYCTLLGLFLYRANPRQTILLMILLLPQIFFSYSMNVIRLGLASGFFLLAMQDFYNNKKKQSLVWLLVSILFQYSFVLVFAIIFFLRFNFKNIKKFLLPIVLFFFVLAGLIYLRMDYFLTKVDIYSNAEDVAGVSGVGKIASIICMIFSICFLSIPLTVKVKNVCIFFLLLLSFVFLSTFSYAGLRMLDLLSFAVAINILDLLQRFDKKLTGFSMLFCFSASLVAVVASVKGYYAFEGTGDSPFLPYSTIFN